MHFSPSGVDGLDDILARLIAHGVDHEPVETYDNGVRHVVVVDSDGNRLLLGRGDCSGARTATRHAGGGK